MINYVVYNVTCTCTCIFIAVVVPYPARVPLDLKYQSQECGLPVLQTPSG